MIATNYLTGQLSHGDRVASVYWNESLLYAHIITTHGRFYVLKRRGDTWSVKEVPISVAE